MRHGFHGWPVLIAGCALLAAGCDSPYHADRGALFGGVTGAGVGALVGHAMGNTGAGAAIGAGVGALTGAAVGSEMDQTEARNRALIEQQMGRQVVAGAVTVNEVMVMVQSGVNEELVVNHIRAHGMATNLQSGDLIALQQQRVPVSVIRAMQDNPPRTVQPVVVGAAPPPVIVEEYDPWWPHRHYYRPYPCYPRPNVSWGISVH
jgi:hypothetical protein